MLLNVCDWRDAKGCKFNRSRHELPIECLVAIIGVDTAEKEFLNSEATGFNFLPKRPASFFPGGVKWKQEHVFRKRVRRGFGVEFERRRDQSGQTRAEKVRSRDCAGSKSAATQQC